jgi:L-methionine (R)-S-oxide reductase
MEVVPSRPAHKSEVPSPAEKMGAYEDAIRQLDSLLAGESHIILKMATINCVLREALPYYFWVGFYLVHDGELVVGPYQGTLGCLHISYDRGVCGAAARTGSVQIVPDVEQFPGHIACDSNSRSEICVPVHDQAGNLIAVFDVDSAERDSFDAIDEVSLSRIMRQHFSRSLRGVHLVVAGWRSAHSLKVTAFQPHPWSFTASRSGSLISLLRNL